MTLIGIAVHLPIYDGLHCCDRIGQSLARDQPPEDRHSRSRSKHNIGYVKYDGSVVAWKRSRFRDLGHRRVDLDDLASTEDPESIAREYKLPDGTAAQLTKDWYQPG